MRGESFHFSPSENQCFRYDLLKHQLGKQGSYSQRYLRATIGSTDKG
jgi:hypothetical protein